MAVEKPEHPSTRSVSLSRLLTIALRNLGRHRRRTLLTSACVAASAAAVVAFMGYYRGTYDQMFYGAIIDYQTAHAQIQAPSLDPEDPSGWVRPTQTLAAWRPAVEAAGRAPAAKGVAPRLEVVCFAGDGREKLPALLAGVDFAAERGVSVFSNRLTLGSFPAARGQVLVGSGIAATFSLAPGSPILVQATTSTGAPNLGRFEVAGIFHTGFAGLDASFLAARLPDVQELADTGDVVNRVYIKLASMASVAGAMPALEAAAALSGGEARPWTRYAEAAIRHAGSETVFYYVFLAILVIVSASAIASTMRVAAFERVREIGTMRAGGWTRTDIFLLFFLESGAVGLCGSAAGIAVGGLLSALLAAFPVDVSSMAEVIDYPFLSMTSSSQLGDVFLAAAIGIGSALAAGLSPARRAARTNIVKALSTH